MKLSTYLEALSGDSIVLYIALFFAMVFLTIIALLWRTKSVLVSVVLIFSVTLLIVTPFWTSRMSDDEYKPKIITVDDFEQLKHSKRVSFRKEFPNALRIIPEEDVKELYFQLSDETESAFIRFNIEEAGPYYFSAKSDFELVDLEFSLFRVRFKINSLASWPLLIAL